MSYTLATYADLQTFVSQLGSAGELVDAQIIVITRGGGETKVKPPVTTVGEQRQTKLQPIQDYCEDFGIDEQVPMQVKVLGVADGPNKGKTSGWINFTEALMFVGAK